MDLTKSIDYFNPNDVKAKCHIIGCGSVGSTLAENLARLGITKFVLYDFDTVSPHNIANQMFMKDDIGKLKTECVKNMICKINPEAKDTITIVNDGYKNQILNGYVFLAVDNIELRRKICLDNRMNRMIKAVFDFRTRLEDAQHYAADWKDIKQIDDLIKTMNFSREDAQKATPVNACGISLGVVPTVRICCAYGICNFINFIKGLPLKKIVVFNAFDFYVDAFG